MIDLHRWAPRFTSTNGLVRSSLIAMAILRAHPRDSSLSLTQHHRHLSHHINERRLLPFLTTKDSTDMYSDHNHISSAFDQHGPLRARCTRTRLSLGTQIGDRHRWLSTRMIKFHRLPSARSCMGIVSSVNGTHLRLHSLTEVSNTKGVVQPCGRDDIGGRMVHCSVGGFRVVLIIHISRRRSP